MVVELDFEDRCICGVNAGVEPYSIVNVWFRIEFCFASSTPSVAGIAILPVGMCTGPAGWWEGGCTKVLVFDRCSSVGL